MSAFVIAEARVSDPERYALAAKAAPGVLEAHGGRFLARGTDITVLEGDWNPSRLMVIRFPDMGAVRAWFDSAAYQEAKALRAGAADMRIVAIDGACAPTLRLSRPKA
jgi:uncharacterized protein (DUF1330 family)